MHAAYKIALHDGHYIRTRTSTAVHGEQPRRPKQGLANACETDGNSDASATCACAFTCNTNKTYTLQQLRATLLEATAVLLRTRGCRALA